MADADQVRLVVEDMGSALGDVHRGRYTIDSQRVRDWVGLLRAYGINGKPYINKHITVVLAELGRYEKQPSNIPESVLYSWLHSLKTAEEFLRHERPRN